MYTFFRLDRLQSGLKVILHADDANPNQRQARFFCASGRRLFLQSEKAKRSG